MFFFDFGYNFPNIFNVISKSLATYECCHSCFTYEYGIIRSKLLKILEYLDLFHANICSYIEKSYIELFSG